MKTWVDGLCRYQVGKGGRHAGRTRPYAAKDVDGGHNQRLTRGHIICRSRYGTLPRAESARRDGPATISWNVTKWLIAALNLDNLSCLVANALADHRARRGIRNLHQGCRHRMRGSRHGECKENRRDRDASPGKCGLGYPEHYSMASSVEPS